MGDGEVAWLYHRETSYGPWRSPRQCAPGFAPMDPRNRPRPFKRYPQARVHALPTDLTARGAPAAMARCGWLGIGGVRWAGLVLGCRGCAGWRGQGTSRLMSTPMGIEAPTPRAKNSH
ncbi:hypothetical protein GCM10022226_78440 [Sphaerisporangium flaviroseum]|uniref:Uncharacterized protein n=1 Tax=Sphaerisporangium flaviroseum TaxID=509199 RepID=A0ABP7JFG4_9ACTN